MPQVNWGKVLPTPQTEESFAASAAENCNLAKKFTRFPVHMSSSIVPSTMGFDASTITAAISPFSVADIPCNATSNVHSLALCL